jgi:hypothetical protein
MSRSSTNFYPYGHSPASTRRKIFDFPPRVRSVGIMKIFKTKGAKSRQRALDLLKLALSKGRVRNNDKATKLVFLCGGSKSDGTVSMRRSQVEDFIRKQFKGAVEVFYAEDYVKSFSEKKPSAELLDMEAGLFKISDRVILILEGYGAACELGAFANPKKQREKLIVINDKKYEKDKSFITLGPIRSIEIANPSENRILYYTFAPDGKDSPDAIADTFIELNDLIVSATKIRSRGGIGVMLPPTMDFSSHAELTQSHIFFVHDLIFLCGPTRTWILVEVLKYLFGDKSFDRMYDAVALLKASNMVKEKGGVYSSVRGRVFLKYTKTSMNQIHAAFKLFNLFLK